MTLAATRKALQADLDALAAKYEGELEKAARAALKRGKGRFTMFAASMGSASFYRKAAHGVDWPIYDSDLPRYARDVLELESDYCRAFGSPGLVLTYEPDA